METIDSIVSDAQQVSKQILLAMLDKIKANLIKSGQITDPNTKKYIFSQLIAAEKAAPELGPEIKELLTML